MAHVVLGIWDGHDSGAAIVIDGVVVCAVNEERFTRRKLEIVFPRRSVAECLRLAGISASQLTLAAYSTTDVAKTLTRLRPDMKEEYYQIRRRKKLPGVLSSLKKAAKYKITEWQGNALTTALSTRVVRRELEQCGVRGIPVVAVEHHRAHAASAILTTDFANSLVLTIDGIGDGLSGSVWEWREGDLKLLSAIPGSASLGIFFEHVTNLLNMRELEDEGKVMALANFASPISDRDNPLIELFSVEGLQVISRYGTLELRRRLKKILWRYPTEQFAFLAQRTLEVHLCALVRNALQKTGLRALACAGGVASNVKVNMLLRELPELDQLAIFPHMGDGGLAIGAALCAAHQSYGIRQHRLPSALLGSRFSLGEIDAAIAQRPGCSSRVLEDPARTVADLLAEGQIVFWFQGRMELGPRALGARSILARPDSVDVKDLLNLSLKRRVWYQPFCPAVLESEARRSLVDYRGQPEPYMTCAYRVRPEAVPRFAGVINVDKTCRPQVVPDDAIDPFARVLRAFKERTGIGAVLNTSFNLHGEPLVCSPADALKTFMETEVRYLVLEDRLVTKDAHEERVR